MPETSLPAMTEALANMRAFAAFQRERVRRMRLSQDDPLAAVAADLIELELYDIDAVIAKLDALVQAQGMVGTGNRGEASHG